VPAVAADVLIVSLGSTEGLRTADDQLAQSLARAGAEVRVVSATPQRRVRTMALTDLQWARAARAAAVRALAQEREARATPTKAGGEPQLIYSSTTAALLWPRAGAVRFDAPAAGNRPGRHGLWQRPLEHRRLEHAPLLLPMSAAGLSEAGLGSAARERALVLPSATDPSGPLPAQRGVAAITYAGDPVKKGLARVLDAWRTVQAARRAGARSPSVSEELFVTGVAPEKLAHAGIHVSPGEGIHVFGPLPQREYRAMLSRARVFVCAPTREDYGAAQLEALADGAQLVSTPAPGPYAALPIARSLDARLIDDDLASALRTALDDPLPGYAERARDALVPYSGEAVDRLVAEQLLPRLLGTLAERP
jgi:Glycosyl transferases group 1